MSALSGQAGDYLRLRRTLGHNLDQAHRLLPDFVTYLDAIGAETVTVEAALAWAQRPDADPATSVWARRMTVARGFARHMTGVDPNTEIPPLGLVRFRQRRRPPFIYSAADITALMSASRRTIPTPLRAATVETIIGLLATTGMRVGEATGFQRGDLDTAEGVITLRHSKFGKSRLVPLHASTLAALGSYAQMRDRLLPRPGKHDLLHLDRRHPALRRGLRQDIPQAAPGDRCRGRGTTPSQGPRHAPQLCCAHPGQVVSRRRGRRRAHAAAIYVPGSPGRVLHLLVPLGRARAAGPGGRAPGS